MYKNLLIATALLTSLTAFAKTEVVTIDPVASKVVWLGKKVTGEHSGELKIQAATLTFEGASLRAAEVTMDMTTITNTDIADKEYNKKLVDHLNSDDFFATSTHKTAKLVVKSVIKFKGDDYKLTGDLTIKGKTAPIMFDATVSKTAAKAVIKFDRTTYDVKYGSGKFFQGLGDKMINDEVQLTINLAVKK